MPKRNGRRPVVAQATVAVELHDLYHRVIVSGGGLTGMGSPVFDATGAAIGFALYNPPSPWAFEDVPDGTDVAADVCTVHSFTQAVTFALALADPPTAAGPADYPYTGFGPVDGLSGDEADYLGLGDRPAIQVADYVSDGPAVAAGFQPGDVIVSIDGRPLDRGNRPADVADPYKWRVGQIRPGTRLTFGVVRRRPIGQHGGPVRLDLPLTLGRLPPFLIAAKRFWSEPLGFGVREPVTLGRYARHLRLTDPGGVIVTACKPDGPATAAGLGVEDLLVQFDGRPTPTLAAFTAVFDDVRRTAPRDPIVLIVKRLGREQTIRVDPPMAGS